MRCARKFTNVSLPAGTLLELTVGGAGGYGRPDERDPAQIASDLLDGLYDEASVRRSYPAQADDALRLRDELLRELRARSEAPPEPAG